MIKKTLLFCPENGFSPLYAIITNSKRLMKNMTIIVLTMVQATHVTYSIAITLSSTREGEARDKRGAPTPLWFVRPSSQRGTPKPTVGDEGPIPAVVARPKSVGRGTIQGDRCRNLKTEKTRNKERETKVGGTGPNPLRDQCTVRQLPCLERL